MLPDTVCTGVFVTMRYCKVFNVIFIVSLWLLPSCLCQTNAVGSVYFHKLSTCPRQMPRDYQVSQVVASTSTGALSCTVTCASSPTCNSIVFDPADKTCHLSQQVAALDCLNMEDIKDSRIYLEKVMSSLQILVRSQMKYPMKIHVK